MTEVSVLDINIVQMLDEVYPRDEFDNETVNNYALNIEDLPPIVVTSEYILIDGYHRLLAHKLAKRQQIKVTIIDIAKDQILWEATKLNARHGKQLTRSEKKRLASHFYKENGCTLAQISEVLGVSLGTLSDSWLKGLVQQEREAQKEDIIALYLQCFTQEEIANKVELTQGRIAQIINDFKTEKTNNLLVPESLQLFNVWNFAKRDKQYGLDFEGAIPGQILENLLYYYTEPFQTVIDPMAGGGTTIDVCKKMYRRYRAYDLKPLRADIKPHDLKNGLLEETHNSDFIFLDPPYFNMVFKDLFTTVEDFKDFLHLLAKESYNNLREGGYVAILMQDMTELGNYVLSGDVFCTFVSHGLRPEAHISCPLSTEQFLPQQVTKAKETKHLLGRNRDLYVFRKP